MAGTRIVRGRCSNCGAPPGQFCIAGCTNADPNAYGQRGDIAAAAEAARELLESPEGQALLVQAKRELDEWRARFDASVAVTPEMMRMRVTI